MMLPLVKRWQISPKIPPEVDQNLSEFHPLFRTILFNRGQTDSESAKRYLAALPAQNADIWLMAGIPEAVSRIRSAIKNQENVVVYGDYDVDGVTATTLLVQVLNELGLPVRAYIPNRFDEGYGLNNQAISSLKESGSDLIITVDCGIRSIEEALLAKKIGLDLIITDHHQPGSILPDAIAVINPKQPECRYPEKDLSGVGLAYKLALAVNSQERITSNEKNLDRVLDLVALGTVADMVPLKGENRSLVRAGLSQIQRPVRQGLLALIGVSGLQPQNISATDIGFMLGPRLNASGRLETALDSMNLLSTTDIHEAGRLAQKLDNQNRERQALTRDIFEHALDEVINRGQDSFIFYSVDENYNPGVVGLAASRLTEKYYRPSIVAHKDSGSTRGSCRSIPEFNITKALDECSDLLDHHGGHAAAAGFTIRNENWNEFIDRIETIAKRELSDLDLRPTLTADVEVKLVDLKPDLIPMMELLQPTGIGNPQAVFVSRNLQVRSSRAIGRENAHLKLTVNDGIISYDAIAFRQGHLAESLPDRIDLMFSFEKNEFNGRQSLQLNVRDIKPSI